MSISVNISNTSQRAKVSYCLFLFLSCIFMYVNLLRDIAPQRTNLVLGGLLIIIMFLMIRKVKEYFIVILFTIGEIITLVYCDDMFQNIDVFANALFVVELLLIIRHSEFVDELLLAVRAIKPFIKAAIYVYPAYILLLLLLPECWTLKDVWDGTYFTVFTAPQAVAANSCMYIALALFYCRAYSRNWYLMIGVILCVGVIVLSGVRVFVISAVVLLYYSVKVYFKKKRTQKWIGITIAALSAAAIASSNTFQMKMDNALKMQSVSGFTFIDALTNSRTIFWRNDLVAYFTSLDPLSIIFGKGHDFVYRINEMNAGYPFWAHNDFIQMLIGQGLVGLGIYLWLLCSFTGKLKAYLDTKIDLLLALLYLFAVPFLSGALVYPNYCLSFIYLLTFFVVGRRISVNNASIGKGEIYNEDFSHNFG